MTLGELIAALRVETGAPPVDGERPPGSETFQVLYGPTFHRPVAITVVLFAGGHGDLTLHGAAPERGGRTWRESRTLVGAELAGLRAALAGIALDALSDRDEAARDGIVLELSAVVAGRAVRVEATSPEHGTVESRLARALLEAAVAALRFDESRALLAPIERYL